MGTLTKLKAIRLSLLQAERAIIHSKIHLIDSVPDIENENITRISKNMFVMSSRHLSSVSWGVEYYDFKEQRRMLQEVIRETSPKKLVPVLEEVFRTGKIIINKGRIPWHYIFNPEYLKKVQEAFNM